MSPGYEPFTPADGYQRPGGRQDWAAPEQQQWFQEQQWAQERQWEQQQQQQWYPQQPAYEPAPAFHEPAPQAYPDPARQGYPDPAAPAGPAGRRGRGRLVVIGLVAALLAVSAWQAFRVEGMIRTSADLASAVTAEQGRSQELEKQLATVFDPEGIAASVLPSVFRVRAGEFTGTAFAVGQTDDGRTNLFTNYHVIEDTFESGEREVSLERGNTRIEATVVKVSAGKDLALLRTEREVKSIGVATKDVRPGQQVVVVGAPLGLDDSVTTGVISAFRPDDADGPTIQFDAPINPGNSGGPVVNTSKQVVGIATAKARDAEGIGLAIPIDTACQTLGACGKG
ncbi:S1C family serine protease [Actinoplanes sp. DH11]|uniref:S1C family serine protease n=1 Tax=Actinoplanes sp. DH11 TaxID=2857011 RepID=UPI001E5D99F0|nr:S1C family serine protease [Actinoplanes sp. DH11]